MPERRCGSRWLPMRRPLRVRSAARAMCDRRPPVTTVKRIDARLPRTASMRVNSSWRSIRRRAEQPPGA